MRGDSPLPAVLLAILVAVVIAAFQSNPIVTGVVLLVVIGFGWMMYAAKQEGDKHAREAEARQKEEEREAVMREIGLSIQQHLPALRLRHAQLVTVDAYGTPIMDRWAE